MDVITLALAKKYAAGAGVSEAGKVQAELDKEILRAKAAEEAAQAAADKAQSEVDALEEVVATKAAQADLTALAGKVGEVPADQTVMGIIQNIQESAYDDEPLRNEINAELAKKADKTQVVTDIANAVKAEEDARKEAVQGVQDAVDALSGTHATDKAALEAAIALKADQTALDTVSGTLADVKADVDAFFKDADITESAKDTLKELQAYISSDETAASEMLASIQQNGKDIDAVEDRLDVVDKVITNKFEQLSQEKASKATTLAGYGITDGVTNEQIEQFSGTVEITSDAPTKEQTVLTINPESETVNLYTAEEVDEKFNQLSEEIDNQQEQIDSLKTQVNQSSVLEAQGDTVEEALAWLAENGDTTKVYLLPNGNQAQYKTVTTEGGTEEVTERITGEFLDDTRLSTNNGGTKAAAGFVTSPFIDVSSFPAGAKTKLTGIRWAYDYDSSADGYAFVLANDDDTVAVANYLYDMNLPYYNLTIDVIAIDTTAGTSTVEIYPTDGTVFKNFTQFRFCGNGTSANTVIEVIYETTTEGGTKTEWVDSGRGLISSDYDERLIELEKKSSAINIPDYVLTGAKEIAEKILSVRNAYSFVSGHITDLHTTGTDISAVGILHAGQAMDEINKRTQLDLLENHGDVVVGKFDDTYKKGFNHVRECFSNVLKSVPYNQMQGNHDELSTDTTEEARQKYFAYIGANNVNTVTDWENRFRNYGYREFTDQKKRIIYLNTADVSESEITTDAYVSASQLLWLVNTALDFSDKSDAEKWTFSLSGHHSLDWYGNISNVLAILNAYKGKTSGSITLDNVTITYNFTDSKAKFIAYYHGHLHNFRVKILGTNKVLDITIPNACFGRNNEYGTYDGYGEDVHSTYGDVDVEGNQRQFNKTANSVNDTAFNICVEDMLNEKIYCFNYGAGIDREITFEGTVTELT